MEYQKILIIVLLLIFSSILYPNMVTAVSGVSPADPLQPLMIHLPLLFILSELIILVYEVINAND